MTRSIFIISSSEDITINPVEQALAKRGYNVIHYKTDLVAKGYIPFTLSLSSTNKPRLEYNGTSIALNTIGAIWQRKPALDLRLSDKASELSVTKEVRALQDGIWNIFPSKRWLNSPTDIRNGEYKVPQLLLAKELGFTIPETLLCNRWSTIQGQLDSDPVVLKMARGILYEGSGSRVLYTTVLPKQDLPIHTNPFPGIWQSYLRKKREWRITVVGQRVFAAAIYTDEVAKDDWRKYDLSDHVIFKEELFPDYLQKKCLQMLKKMHLRYGAFDFVEDHNGTITFLEVNPSGQYLWLEKTIGLPISEAIADELIAIAMRL